MALHEQICDVCVSVIQSATPDARGLLLLRVRVHAHVIDNVFCFTVLTPPHDHVIKWEIHFTTRWKSSALYTVEVKLNVGADREMQSKGSTDIVSPFSLLPDLCPHMNNPHTESAQKDVQLLESQNLLSIRSGRKFGD